MNDKEKVIQEIAQINEVCTYSCKHCEGKCGAYEDAIKLYNAGYRKTFTSTLATNEQKAYKEGYQKGLNDATVEKEVLKRDIENLTRTIEEGNELYQETLHRAEVAERALRDFANITPCDYCPYKYRCDSDNNTDYEQCFNTYLKQAEKDQEMSNKYQEKLDALLKDDYTAVSKLYMLYELIAFTDNSISDELLEVFYRTYIDSNKYNSVYDFVLAIQNWCERNGTDFSDIKDYQKMLDEIQ